MNLQIDDQGGIIPAPADLARAKKSDLGTLPTNIPGTNCGNCEFFQSFLPEAGMCVHPQVRQPVTVRMCCAFWNSPGYLRHFK